MSNTPEKAPRQEGCLNFTTFRVCTHLSIYPKPSLIHDLENTSDAALQPKALYAGDVYQNQPVVVVTEEAYGPGVAISRARAPHACCGG